MGENVEPVLFIADEESNWYLPLNCYIIVINRELIHLVQKY